MARILLIDDLQARLDGARRLLGGDGHDLVEATDALAGLHRAVEDDPDCIVVELALQGLDGLELSRRLSTVETMRPVPVIVWGTVEASVMGRLARAAGAFAYVDRARTPSALRGTVRRAIAEGRVAARPASAPAATRRSTPR